MHQGHRHDRSNLLHRHAVMTIAAEDRGNSKNVGGRYHAPAFHVMDLRKTWHPPLGEAITLDPPRAVRSPFRCEAYG